MADVEVKLLTRIKPIEPENSGLALFPPFLLANSRKLQLCPVKLTRKLKD